MPLSPGGEGNYKDLILDVVVMHKLFVGVCIYLDTHEMCVVGLRLTFFKLGHLELGT